jgi:hypothetical protein
LHEIESIFSKQMAANGSSITGLLLCAAVTLLIKVKTAVLDTSEIFMRVYE